MPTASSRTAPIVFLDVAGAVRALTAAAGRLRAADANVLAVVLFGSLADGSATPGSDADLLVVLRADARRVMDRAPQYAQWFEETGVAVDVWPWTLDELGARRAAGDPFAREILGTGRALSGTIATLTGATAAP